MSIHVEIDEGRRLRTTTFSGTLDDALLLGYYQGTQANFDPHLNALLDLTAVDQIKVTPGGMRELDKLFKSDRLAAERRVAMVAPTDVLYGMARMYEILHQDSIVQVRVFRNYDEALDWALGAAPAG